MDKMFFVVVVSCFFNVWGFVVCEVWFCSVILDWKFLCVKCFEKWGSCWCGINMYIIICMKVVFIVILFLLLIS